MAASVLNSAKAVEMSIFVVRAFVRLRRILASNRQLAAKLNELERRIATHDKNLVDLFQAVRSLMAAPEKPKRDDLDTDGCSPAELDFSGFVIGRHEACRHGQHPPECRGQRPRCGRAWP
jgi:hypothetical protein